MIDRSELLVWYNGKKMFYLNAHLVSRQMLNLDDVKKIRDLHVDKINVIVKMRRSRKPETLKALAASITEIEYKLQEAWKFPKDEAFHRFWEVPKCECPKLDNEDRYPTGRYIINCDCPIHGGK